MSGARETAVQPNRAERLRQVIERDGSTCVWCGRELTGLVRATTEHLVPRLKGGPSWLENEVAACRRCNAARGHAGVAEWLQECERRSWSPDAERVVRTLTALEAAIARRGGQRRARPYVAAQLRRLRAPRQRRSAAATEASSPAAWAPRL